LSWHSTFHEEVEVRIRRLQGFTLIELLVVIAIIAILAAMLFPVFARARESARKIQCLSNVKNIATAIQMYLTDYDRFPPGEHRQEVIDYFASQGVTDCSLRVNWANPYLRFPVVLDEYVRNRDVWHCPTAVYSWATGINPCFKDWFAILKDNADWAFWCTPECNAVFPNGWGGTITDSYYARQGCADADTGAIAMGIGIPRYLRDEKTAQVNDPAKYLVVGDVGSDIEPSITSRFAYADMHGVEKAACKYPQGDWVNCPATQVCAANDPRLQLDPTYRKQRAGTRHLGGSNIGFADGHATWMAAEAILFGGEAGDYVKDGGLLQGVQNCGFGPPDATAQAILSSK
jgi:prepilin-type N-terminal cleavage/methylation domain-containing protein/prepilin-type processing-associated H-X9-DG protein